MKTLDPYAEARTFFDRLYKGQTGVLELRTFDHPKAGKLRDFVPVAEGIFDFSRVEAFLKGTEKLKIGAFFGVALRTKESLSTRKGDATHCQVLTTLFVDADFKHLGEEETRKRIKEFPLKPSMIVCSGGGLHPYWVLDDPIYLQIAGGLKRSKLLLRQLASKVADVVDETVSEPVRVLRIPGSYNFKKDYELPRLVCLEEVNE